MNFTCNLSAEFIKRFSIESGVDFVGVASPDRFKGAPEGHQPQDLLKSVRSIIVCGKAVPIGSIFVPGTLNHKVIEMIQLQLDQIALKITQEIEKNGGVAIPIPTHAPYYYWDEERQYGQGDLSLKHAAEAAGLGKIGKSSVFISKDYGILTRLVCILTDVILEPDQFIDWEPCNEDCHLCVDSCPVNAIKADKVCEQALCRRNIFKKTLKGIQFEDCRECLRACPWLFKRPNMAGISQYYRSFNVVNPVQQNNSRENVVISTLGPAGTCSEYAAEFFMNKNKFIGKVSLYPTFEEAVEALKGSNANYTIIPSAYQNLAEIIFQGLDFIEITEVFKLETPNLVIAGTSGKKEIKKVATHSSPSTLAKRYFPDVQLVLAKSNSNAAEMLLADEVDACVTTVSCAKEYCLDIKQDFGSVVMGWNVLKRK